MNEEKYIDSRSLSKQIKDQIKTEASALKAMGIVPRMAAVLATEDASAIAYVKSKQRVAVSLGIQLDIVELKGPLTQNALDLKISSLSIDPDLHGILIELPLSEGLDGQKVLELIPPYKDIDGLTSANLGLTISNKESDAITSATAQACIELIEIETTLTGKKVALIGRGRTVGRPLIGMLINRNATVTICHSQTKDLTDTIKDCEIVVVAIGKAKFVNRSHLSDGQIIIDAGINVVGDSVFGDVDFDDVIEKVRRITPVPGGVGSLTTAIIFRNLIRAVKFQMKKKGKLI